jgi:ElaB/YqjD/DUF883 family membrane-anchored ribosome-binding protein
VIETADAGRVKAADGMDRAAERLRQQSPEGAAGAVAERTADAAERTATYLREHDTKQMWTDMERYVQEHPMQGVAGALAAGFLIGRMLR